MSLTQTCFVRLFCFVLFIFGPFSLIYDAEFDDNLDRPLSDLNITDQSMLNVEDDAQEFKLLVSVIHSEGFDPESEKQFELVGGVPAPTGPSFLPSVWILFTKQTHKLCISFTAEAKKPEPPAPDESSGSSSNKRKFESMTVDEEDDLVIVEPPSTTSAAAAAAAAAITDNADPKGKKKQKISTEWPGRKIESGNFFLFFSFSFFFFSFLFFSFFSFFLDYCGQVE
jgi:hypothetical protein